MCQLHSCYASPPVAATRTKMGQMSNRSSNRRELRVLGSFRNFAHRQEAVGSFRKSVVSGLRLQNSVYEIPEIRLMANIQQLTRSENVQKPFSAHAWRTTACAAILWSRS